MAVHVPLSIEAQIEARVLMMSTNNILSPAHGKPIILPTQDIVLGLYHMTRHRPFAKGEWMTFSSFEETRIAYDAGAVNLQARIKVRYQGEIIETTVGRSLLREIVPMEVPFEVFNQVMNKKTLATLIDDTYRRCGSKDTVLLADDLRTWGYEQSTRAGISFSIKDLTIPTAKSELLEGAQVEVAAIEDQYTEGLITQGERYNKVIDIWAQVTDRVADKMMDSISKDVLVSATGETEETPSFNPIFIMADSGARGSPTQIRQLAGMRGLMAKPSGEIIETPITANFREGLSVLQYFISTHGARKGLADTALKTANSGYLTRRLVDVAQDSVIAEFDCGTIDGLEVEALTEGGQTIEPLSERILGRVCLDDLYDPFNADEVLAEADIELTEELVAKIEAAGVQSVPLRSPLTCRTRGGVCVLCYGRDLSRGRLVNIGETVGIIAAQSIGEPGTQLTMRTFHVGGAASKEAEASQHEARNTGTLRYRDLRVVEKINGTFVAMNRNGSIFVEDETGRERESHQVVYGANVLKPDGAEVTAGDKLTEWDPWSLPIITEVGGIVKFGDIVEGQTMKEQLDEVTGLSRKVVMEAKDAELRPRIMLKNPADPKTTLKTAAGNPAQYALHVGSNIAVTEGQVLDAGDVLAKVPRETTKTKDITGGLPRVAELFEARKPKEPAVISEIEGTVSFGKGPKGKRKVIVTPEIGEKKEYVIAKGKPLAVHEGDYVRAGEALMDGSSNPHDILRVMGERALAKYLVDEIQEVYRLQGVRINDKHVETIVRQMLRWVKIVDVGDTDFLADQQVEKWMFEEENERIMASGGQPGVGEPLLLGITKASLSTESFISASSFQETTKVLTEASLSGKIDYLRGLKENVIMGRLIPAGTGVHHYKHLGVNIVDGPAADLDAVA
jgi:DNA-directed RNA polymerase subunit beta'